MHHEPASFRRTLWRACRVKVAIFATVIAWSAGTGAAMQVGFPVTACTHAAGSGLSCSP